MQETQLGSLDWKDPLEKEMATHSSVLAWRIPGMGEPGGLPSLGSHRVGHDWSDLAAAAAVKLSGVWSTEIQVLLLFLKCKKKKKKKECDSGVMNGILLHITYPLPMLWASVYKSYLSRGKRIVISLRAAVTVGKLSAINTFGSIFWITGWF